MDVQGVTLLRALKGAPLACLVALGLVGDTISADWIQSATGYNHQAVQKALSTLVALGLVSRVNYRGWRLSESPGEGEVFSRSDENQRFSPAATTGVFNILIKSSMGIAETAADGRCNENQCLEAGASSGGGVNGSETDQRIMRPRAERSKAFREAVEALREAGIGEPTRSRLAVLPHVTASYVRAHALLAARDGIRSGLLVHRLRSGDEAPKLNAQGHLRDCKCESCGRLWDVICGECFRYPCECEESK